MSGQVAEITIYHVQTITALITSTAVQISTVTQCPLVLSSELLGGPLPAPSPPVTSAGPVPGADAKGPCPGYGYTCDDCLDGWFCPPVQTPAQPAPCGYGWPCYHCEGGWFCVPLPEDTPGATLLASASTSSVVTPTPLSANNGYLYAGCYADDSTRVLSKAEVLDLPGGMTNEECIRFCEKQGLTLAGTEHGAQCFCGNVLLGSASLSPDHCNVTCTGDLTNSTVCGGSWALSVWSSDGTAHQQPSLASLPDVVEHYGPAGERRLPSSVNAAIHASLMPSPVVVGVAGLGDMPSSAFRSRGLATSRLANASRVAKSFSSILDTGSTSPASDLTFATATSKDLHPNSSDSSFGLGHIVSGNFTAANTHNVAPDETSEGRDGDEWVTSAPPMTLSSKNKRWGPRGRARRS